MRNPVILFVLLVTLTFCKGRSSGPLVREPFEKTETGNDMNNREVGSKVAIEKTDVRINPCSDCLTISSLLKNKKSYSGKMVKVKGIVTKYNSQIMGKNWIHIQDGSELNGEFDLTITTEMQVSLGDTVTFEGRITLDKDFGYGYFYNVLMENGMLKFH